MHYLDEWNTHKVNLNKFKRIRIIRSMFSVCNGIKLEISSGKIYGKFQNKQWKLNNETPATHESKRMSQGKLESPLSWKKKTLKYTILKTEGGS